MTATDPEAREAMRAQIEETLGDHRLEFLYGEWAGCSCGEECPYTHSPEEWHGWHEAHLADVLLGLWDGDES